LNRDEQTEAEVDSQGQQWPGSQGVGTGEKKLRRLSSKVDWLPYSDGTKSHKDRAIKATE